LTAPPGGIGTISKSVAFNTGTYKHCILRVATFNSTQWHIYFKLAGAAVWSKVQWTTGLFQYDVYSEVGAQNVDEVELWVWGISGTQVSFDYIAICKQALLNPDIDLVYDLTVNRRILSKGRGTFRLTLPNSAGEYTGAVNKFDNIIIWVSRVQSELGNVAAKVFGGKILEVENEGEGPEFYVNLSGEDYGFELSPAPGLHQKYYSAVNGKTIIEDALTLCSYLAKAPNKFFDCHTNCGINSTHTVTFEEIQPFNTIKEMADKVQNPAAVKGYDLYVTPAGCVVAHLKNSSDHNSAITSLTPERYSQSIDVQRVRNKIKVYGSQNKKYPSDGDQYTEQAASETPADDGWSADADATLSWDTGEPQRGDESLKAIRTGSSLNVWNDLPGVTAIDCSGWKRDSYKKLHFHIYYENSLGEEGTIIVWICAPNTSNRYNKKIVLKSGKWREINIELGPDSTDIDGAVGSPSWDNVQRLQWFLTVGSSANLTLKIDELYFGDRYFSGSSEDTYSQGDYGTRVADPEIDGNLNSDAECAARAEAIKDFYKDPTTVLSNILTDGDYRFTPGDRQRIVVSNDNLDAYFRIVEVQQVIRGAEWDSILTLSDEPQFVDYVFRLLKDRQSLLERKS